MSRKQRAAERLAEAIAHLDHWAERMCAAQAASPDRRMAREFMLMWAYRYKAAIDSLARGDS